MSPSVSCLVNDRAHASRVLLELERAGFSESVVSEIELDGHETPIVTHDHSRTMLRGAAVCALAGGVLGGALGWIASLASRPETATFLTSQPLFLVVAGAVVGAAVGSLTGSMIGLGVSQPPSERSSIVFPRQRVRVHVHAFDTEQAPGLERILREAGAEVPPRASWTVS